MATDEDILMSSQAPDASNSAPPSPRYGGFTRFEIELEFVQSLASPSYLVHLATSNSISISSSSSVPNANNNSTIPTPLLQHQPFIEYLKYLQYWQQPEYAKYLMYPGPTLKNLELLQNERFRREILSPEKAEALGREGILGVARYFGGEAA